MNFAELALICLVAIVGPVLSVPRAFQVPVVVGELAVGLLLGRTGFQVLDASNPVLTFLAEIGFVLVMFVAGTSVSLRGAGVWSVVRAVAVGVVSVPLAVLVAHVFGTGHAALYAVLFASSSAATILPMLNGTPLKAKPLAEMVPQIAIADTVSIVSLPLVLDQRDVPRAATGALLVIAGAVAAYWALRWARTKGVLKRVHDLSGDRGLALELRVLLTLLFALAAIAQAMGISTMLAGFVTGVAVSKVGQPRRVAKQFFALTEGFFGPIFFVWVGAQLDLRSLGDHPQAILLGIALAVAPLIAHGAMVVTGQPLPIALTTAAQMGVPVAAIALSAPRGLLIPGEDAAMLLGALLTVVTTTLLTGSVIKLAR